MNVATLLRAVGALTIVAAGRLAHPSVRPVAVVGADTTKPYAAVIPASAKTRHGLFTVHQVGERLYFEIPKPLLDTDMLLVNQGNEQATIRWERQGGRILLRNPESLLPDDSTYAKWLVTGPRSRMAPIVAQFPIETIGADGAVVIEVTPLFTTNLGDFPKGGGAFDAQRSFIERVEAYPDNVFITVTVTRPGGGQSPTASYRRFWNVMRLPAQPMRPRLFDPRAGFFIGTRSNGKVAFDLEKDEPLAYILRWRLEKKDPTAAMSEPVKPIVFYLDPATPAKWRPWIKAGVEAWQSAFEMAGFTHAIIAREPPADDSTWSIQDTRNSIVYWEDTPTLDGLRTGGGTAGWLIDGRTGELLRADVRGVGTLHRNLSSLWYFAWAASLDPRAQHLPMPDSIDGAMLQFVVSHEVGHALGLEDGSYGKFAYPVDSLRSRAWVHRMGFTPSVMNYSRLDYVAQPEDSIPPIDLVQHVGPADRYSMMWGYTPIPEARTPADERTTFDVWARMQDTVPWYRFVGMQKGRMGPYTIDALDDNDPVRSAGFGLKNLHRVMRLLPGATIRPGEDNTDAARYYAAVLKLWGGMHERLVDMVGGMEIVNKSGSQPGAVYLPISASRQRSAMRFLDSSAFVTPRWLVDPELTHRFEANGTVERIAGLQARVLRGLLEADRLHRLVETEVTASDRRTVYGISEMLGGLRRSVWSELHRPVVTIDPYRQELQRAYVLQVTERVTSAGSLAAARQSSAYETAVLYGEITTLRGEITSALTHTTDRTTSAHLRIARDLLDRTLRPRAAEVPAAR